MLLQVRYGSGCIVGDVLLRELQELVDEDQWRAGPLEVLHGDKPTKRTRLDQLMAAAGRN